MAGLLTHTGMQGVATRATGEVRSATEQSRSKAGLGLSNPRPGSHDMHVWSAGEMWCWHQQLQVEARHWVGSAHSSQAAAPSLLLRMHS